MYPPIFRICRDSPEVVALLGDDPMRLWPFGEAPQDEAKPYAVWQIISGLPENYITNTPDIDQFGVQVDVYARDIDSTRDIARALRDAIEPHAHIVAWRGESREAETKLYRLSFDVNWFVHR